ncbi:unnamed protein product [Debaryomyces tyrocola]|nr:unnamed protein product [Debaryomyces tyrocola]
MTRQTYLDAIKDKLYGDSAVEKFGVLLILL